MYFSVFFLLVTYLLLIFSKSKLSAKYNTYANDSYYYELKEDPNKLTYVTLNFDKITLSKYTRLVVETFAKKDSKDNPYLKMSVIADCLRISKESIFTGTNNFVTEKFETLLSGGTIREVIEENLTYNVLTSSEQNLWSLLYCRTSKVCKYST